MIDKSFIDRILALAPTEVIEIDGKKYTDSTVVPVIDPVAKALEVHTLTGLVDYFDKMTDAEKNACLFHVHDHHRVSLISTLFGDFRQRETFITATAFPLEHKFDRNIPVENFIVYLQSMFVQDETVEKIIRVVGNLTQGSEMKVADDGMTQIVTAKAGVHRLEVVDLPNPVTLRPFRTFMDIDQPWSKFILRIKASKDDGPMCALYDADGGAWKNRAIGYIKDYLEMRKISVQIVA